jgi:excisionase family DNA binding protein
MRAIITLPDQDSFSIKETAHALGVHLATAWRYTLRGVHGHRLRAIRVGGRRRVLRSDLVSFLEELNNGDHSEVGRISRQAQHAHQASEAKRVEASLLAEGF